MKRITVFLALFLCIVFSALPAAAAVDSSEKVQDYAGLFTAEQVSVLETRIAGVSESRDFDILILTEEKPGITNSERYGDAFYDDYGYGFGEHGDGVLLFINMGEREVYFSAVGRCEPLYLSHIDPILDDVYEDLAAGDYYGAAETFLDDIESIVEDAGELPDYALSPDPVYTGPIPGYTGPSAGPGTSELLLQSLAVGAGVALVAMIVLIALHMRSLPSPPSYRTYLGGDVKIKRQDDVFLTTHTSRVRIQSNSGASGGGGGGGGRSRSGGTRRF